jgi:hypothetical protein
VLSASCWLKLVASDGADRSATSSGMTSPLPIHLGVCRHRARSSPSNLASSPVIRCSLYPSRPEPTGREPAAAVRLARRADD